VSNLPQLTVWHTSIYRCWLIPFATHTDSVVSRHTSSPYKEPAHASSKIA